MDADGLPEIEPDATVVDSRPRPLTQYAWNVSDEEYHADLTHESHSTLELFRESVPLYKATRVQKTMAPRQPTNDMIVGSAFHCLLLEPSRFSERFAYADIGITRRHKAWDEFRDGCAVFDRQPLLYEDYSTISRMVAAARHNSAVCRLLDDAGRIEQPLVWTDHATGLPLRCKPDIVTRGGLVVDVKTTSGGIDPESWARTIHTYGYHRQASMILQATELAYDDIEADTFVHLAISKTYPHESVVYRIDDASMQLGYSQNVATMRELLSRRQSGDWTSRYAGKICEVGLPRWAFDREIRRPIN